MRQVNYAEAYIMMLHLKAVRVFVESVLRYGLTESYDHLAQSYSMTPNFKSFFLHPKKGKTEALRKVCTARCTPHIPRDPRHPPPPPAPPPRLAPRPLVPRVVPTSVR